MVRWLVGAFALGALGVALASAAPAAASDGTVTILGLNQGYSPASVTVNPGDSVTWTNRDPSGAPHNAFCDNSCPEAFSSGPPGGNGSSGSVRFRYSGTYKYICAVHPNMTGTVVVTGDVRPPASSGSSAPGSASVGGPPVTANAYSSAGNASAVANSGASAVANATSGSSQSVSSSSGSDSSASTTAVAVPGLGQLALPSPEVRVRRASSNGTPGWALVPATMVLLVAATACGVAWLGRRPL